MTNLSKATNTSGGKQCVSRLDQSLKDSGTIAAGLLLTFAARWVCCGIRHKVDSSQATTDGLSTKAEAALVLGIRGEGSFGGWGWG